MNPQNGFGQLIEKDCRKKGGNSTLSTSWCFKHPGLQSTGEGENFGEKEVSG